MKRTVVRWLGAAVLLLACGAALAQAYPSRPIHFIIPFAAGGGSDVMARIIAEPLSQRMGVPIIVENKPGANAVTGADYVAKSAPDGYTMLHTSPGPQITNPFLMPKLPYDPVKDLQPVARLGVFVNVLVVHPSVPAKNLKEFVALGKSKPGTLNFASLGQATTQGLAGTLFNMMTGIDAVQIPYKGSAPGTTDLLAGNVQYMFNALPSELAHIQSGRLRALGVSSLKRSPSLPDVPPINDTVKGYDVTTWYSLVAPAGTPPEIVDKLNKEIAAIIESPAVREKIREQGVEADAMTPAQLGAHLHKERDRWAKVIRDAKIQQE